MSVDNYCVFYISDKDKQVVGLAVVWLNKKRVELAAKIKGEIAKKYYDLATDAVLKAVQYTMQTYVDSLKKSGTFTKEAQETAFAQTKRTV